MFLLYCYRHHRDLHSFPTRRSSDLRARPRATRAPVSSIAATRGWKVATISCCRRSTAGQSSRTLSAAVPYRSEEHTSELQSLTNLVCRLLLEKKKKNN